MSRSDVATGPFGGYADLDTASAPRRVDFYRRLSKGAIRATSPIGSIPVLAHNLRSRIMFLARATVGFAEGAEA